MICLAWLVHRLVAVLLGLCGFSMVADVLLIHCREWIYRGKANLFLLGFGFLIM